MPVHITVPRAYCQEDHASTVSDVSTPATGHVSYMTDDRNEKDPPPVALGSPPPAPSARSRERRGMETGILATAPGLFDRRQHYVPVRNWDWNYAVPPSSLLREHENMDGTSGICRV